MTQQPPTYAQPYPQQPPPAPKKRKVWPWILLGIAAVLLLGCGGIVALVGFGLNKAADDVTNNAAGKNAKTAAIGQPARDGKFEFTVTNIKCGATKVGSGFLQETAQGQFCIVDVTVRNIGKEAQTFDGSAQKAYDAKGTEFSNSGAAELVANDGNETFINQINPGNQVRGKVVFDVPKQTALTSVVLHDSPFSGGIRVNLS